jgi:FAD:protein FMN transferase
MGSPLRLVLDGPAWSVADAEAWEIVATTFAGVEAALSRFVAGSELSRLNATAGSGVAVPVSPLVRSALVLADRAHRVTGGRFDPRVIVALEAVGERAGVELPAAPRIPAPGPWIEVTREGHVRIGAPVDLGGLGKGVALRAARSSLEAAGVRRFLVEAGGDLVVGAPDGDRWRVGVEDPWHPPFPLVGLEVASAAIATSSVAVRSWIADDGREAHHLIDPATGVPGGDGLAAVTVAATDPAWAEVWSKALFLAGADGIEATAQWSGLAAWWVTANRRVGASAAARAIERYRLLAA